MIQRSGFSKRELKKFTWEVNLAESTMGSTPKYIDWPEQSIIFG